MFYIRRMQQNAGGGYRYWTGRKWVAALEESRKYVSQDAANDAVGRAGIRRAEVMRQYGVKKVKKVKKGASVEKVEKVRPATNDGIPGQVAAQMVENINTNLAQAKRAFSEND